MKLCYIRENQKNIRNNDCSCIFATESKVATIRVIDHSFIPSDAQSVSSPRMLRAVNIVVPDHMVSKVSSGLRRSQSASSFSRLAAGHKSLGLPVVVRRVSVGHRRHCKDMESIKGRCSTEGTDIRKVIPAIRKFLSKLAQHIRYSRL